MAGHEVGPEYIDAPDDAFWASPEGVAVLGEVEAEIARLVELSPERYESAARFLGRELAVWASQAWGPEFSRASLKALSAHADRLAASTATCSDGACSLAAMAGGVHAMHGFAVQALMARYRYSERLALEVLTWILEDPP